MDWAFGLTMTIMGMVVTILTLLIFILVIRLLNRWFPFKKEEETEKSES